MNTLPPGFKTGAPRPVALEIGPPPAPLFVLLSRMLRFGIYMILFALFYAEEVSSRDPVIGSILGLPFVVIADMALVAPPLAIKLLDCNS